MGGSFTPPPLYRRKRAYGTHWIGGWVNPRADLDDVEKRKEISVAVAVAVVVVMLCRALIH
jgi:hypothetical protein